MGVDRIGKKAISISFGPECGNSTSLQLMSTLSTIEDRICIASNGEEKMRLSMFHLLTCCQECGGCRGGNPEAVYIYWVKYGITTGKR